MPTRSETVRSLLRSFYESWFGQGGRMTFEEEMRQVGQLGELRDPSAIPGLVEILCGGGGHVAATAAGAIEQIVESCGPLDLAQLDRTVRDVSVWRSPRLAATDVSRISLGMVGPLGALSCHRDGHVRESAVRALADVRNGRELPFLLIRINDWVPQVRDVARDAVDRRVRPEYASHFVPCLPLIYRLREQGRGDHGRIVKAVLGMLRDGGCRPMLRAALSVRDRHTRRLAFRLLADMPGEDPLPLLREALETDDTVIRLWAAREMRQVQDGQTLNDLMERLWSDRFMPVRREALCGYAEREPEATTAHLIAGLLDPHVSIRETARFYLRGREMSDFATFYRDRLSGGGDDALAAAVAGLGESGGRDDARRLATFLRHANPRVRRAAVRAVGRLDPDAFADEMAAALNDRNSGVAKAARDVIRTRPYLVPPEKLWSLFEREAGPHVRWLSLDLIAPLAWWESSSFLIRAAATGDPSIRNRSEEYMHRWMGNAGRYAARPTPEQVRRLEEAMALYPDVIAGRIADDLRRGLAWTKRAVT